MITLRGLIAVVAVPFTLSIGAASAEAQRFGGQLSWGSDSDVGVGGRAEFNMSNVLSTKEPFSRAFIIAQFDYYFIDCPSGADCSYWELNPTLAIPIRATSLRPYVGAGLNIAHASVDIPTLGGGSDTDTGINLLAGLKFNVGTADAFSEARISLGGGEQFALSFGFLFGGKSP
ncbi:MAG TPA: hypothetical protein VFT29_10185 [Gemmatimonadaceae bacterium]|nr:hypothetical protein [Gemmatimonadaceae bacterium]